ncbi:HigA family addiction module antidote protein [Pseudomonas sp. RIT778]|jgi:addiction module HigA family antidote|uniref:HigA family addiction module antitoxin n=1 Tax=unclassified Pseudomonas TaxID=196821 RepID=UPI001C870C7E|nr:HigA family addiction module antitoxin [Pseudomonas sp. RIT778]MBX8470593.1 HigA family addiction module antidote protein [Pseudomonas sp. RIT778]
MDRNGMRPTHPGEVLNKEFMEPLGMTVMDLGMPTNWPETEIEKLVKCQLRICADLAIRLAIHLNTTPEFWMNLQSTYDLRKAEV